VEIYVKCSYPKIPEKGSFRISESYGDQRENKFHARFLRLSLLFSNDFASKTTHKFPKKEAFADAKAMVISVKINFTHGFCGFRCFSATILQAKPPTNSRKRKLSHKRKLW